MICEKAEDYLSAYLDDMLDPQLRQEIEAHLESCAHCREVLAEYRRFDELLVSVPRVAPPKELHDRIFQSSEVAALIRAQGGRTSVPLLDRPAATGEGATSAEPLPMRVRSSSPPWKRVALQSAAVIALLLGSALLIKQGLLHSDTTSGQGSVLTLGSAQNNAPLSAGNRAVYERGGALWSVPEAGPELARQLTPAGVRVAGWAVSPDGRLVTYTDVSGRIHIIRSDDQRDTIVGRVSAAALPNGFWDTAAGRDVAQSMAWAPDGGSIAYVAIDHAGRMALHIMSSSGAKDVSIASQADQITSLAWSPRGGQLAFVETTGASQTLVAYEMASKQAQTAAAQADPDDVAASFSIVRWMPGDAQPTLTWAASDGNTITGVFSQFASAGGDVHRLTQPGKRYTAADFSAHGSGEWMLAEGNANATLDVVVPQELGNLASTATQGDTIAHIVWSPDGATAAYLTRSGQLGVWAPGSAPATIAANAASVPVWSADGSRLAVQVSNGVLSVRVASGQPTVLARLVTAPGSVSLLWAPDNQSLVVSGRMGVVVAAVDGSVKIADSQPVDTASIAWTVAK